MGLRGIIIAALLMSGTGLFAPPALHAQQGARSYNAILTIDQDRLFKASLFGERIAQEINAELAKLEAQFKQLEADLTAEEKALTEQRSILAPQDFRLLADAFDEKVQLIRREQDAKARAVDHRLEQERAKYYRLINPILRELTVDLGATLIIDRRAIVLMVDGVDITNEALRRIDATLGDGATPPILPQE